MISECKSELFLKFHWIDVEGWLFVCTAFFLCSIYIYIYIDFLQHMKDKNAIYFGNSAHLQHQQVLNQISICQLLVCLPSIQVIQDWVRGDSRTRPALTRCLSRFHSYILSLITPPVNFDRLGYSHSLYDGRVDLNHSR